jgi:hypothetical protein
MTDHELAERFEDGTLPPQAFHHGEHVRVAWWYLARFDRAEADRRLQAGLRALATRAGKPEKFDAALTTAWVDLLADAATTLGPDATFEALAAARPDLLDPASVRALR